jgi:hypothetical protein
VNLLNVDTSKYLLKQIPQNNMEQVANITKGTRRCFVGSHEIEKSVNHGWDINTFNTLVEQSGITIKEWNGKEWIDLHTNYIKVLQGAKP